MASILVEFSEEYFHFDRLLLVFESWCHRARKKRPFLNYSEEKMFQWFC